MTLFLLLYLTIYGGLNTYTLLKLRTAFRLGPHGTFWLILLFIIMVLAPFLVRQLEHHNLMTGARLCAGIAYTWMALVFWFFGFSILFDAWNLIIRLLGFLGLSIIAKGLILSPAWSVGLSLTGMAFLAGIAQLLENHLSVETHILKTERFRPDTPPLRIVQISDLHLGLTQGRERLDQVLVAIKALNPDILVSTGDFIDSIDPSMNALADHMAALTLSIGKFAVFGNHEFYTGVPGSTAWHQRAGFTILRHASTAVDWHGTPIIISGVDDPAVLHSGKIGDLREGNILPPAAQNRPFSLLLKHQPRVSAEAIDRFDLQLSGHTHGGQIFPFHLFVRWVYPYFSGTHHIPPHSLLYTNRGTGSWGPSMRLGSTREITLWVISPAHP